MANLITRAGALGQYVTATTQTIPTLARALATPMIGVDKPVVHVSNAGCLPASGATKITSGIGVATQVTQRRFAHTDVKIPDFGGYKKADKFKTEEGGREAGKVFTYLMIGGAIGTPVVYGAKSMVTKFVASMGAAADVRALAKIEVNLDEIPEGKNVVFKWRGKPLFVRHRSQEEIDEVRSVNVAELRDPQKDEVRVQEDKWLVLLGICTHLGCVPIANEGDYGGYYCPCHGSHYDASGRIRKGPAPLNLEIPEYTIQDSTLVVG